MPYGCNWPQISTISVTVTHRGAKNAGEFVLCFTVGGNREVSALDHVRQPRPSSSGPLIARRITSQPYWNRCADRRRNYQYAGEQCLSPIFHLGDAMGASVALAVAPPALSRLLRCVFLFLHTKRGAPVWSWTRARMYR